MSALPLPNVAAYVREATPENLTRYFGANRVETALAGVRSACWLWDGSLLLEFDDHLETLPPDPSAAARAVYPVLRAASGPREVCVPSCWPVQASSR